MRRDKQLGITLRWDQHQHAYVAEATDFPGVVGKGSTHEEALAAVKDAIRWHAEAATEERPSTPSPSEWEEQPSPK